jgi:hypothetical protein
LSTPASSRTSRLLQALRRPAAFVASNWAGLIGVASVVGTVPALAGAMRVVTALDRYEDEPFVTPLRQARATWRRDLPVTLLIWVVGVFGALNAYAVAHVASSVRVLVVGFLVPVVWGVIGFVSAYVAAASALPLSTHRHDVLALVATMIRARPLRSFLTPVLLVAMAPVIVLPPFTVAAGVSLPGWVIGEWLGVAGWRRALDPDDAPRAERQ